MAKRFNAKSFQDWQELLELKEIDIVIVCTLHDTLSEISEAALLKGKNVLVEKPGARNLQELERLKKVSFQCKSLLRFGFNHRYHQSLIKAKEIVDKNLLGELMFIRGRYGHGGRLGYNKEWRADKKISGGGELIDQGPHLMTSQWFLEN